MVLELEEELWLAYHLRIPFYPQIQLLKLVNNYYLDPLSDEIAFLPQGSDKTYQSSTSINGHEFTRFN